MNDKLTTAIDQTRSAFEQAMNDDFNAPAALAELQGFRSVVNKLLEAGLSTKAKERARQLFRFLGSVMGIFQLESWRFNVDLSDIGVIGLDEKEIEENVRERNEARKQKDFKKADEIRQFLKSHGIDIEDKPDGTSRWKR
jgi:cysteinyl-tRNA synthetase